MDATVRVGHLHSGMQAGLRRAVGLRRGFRLFRGAGYLRCAGLGLLAGLLLAGAVAVRAQDPTKHQEKLIDHESGFLGDSYEKLVPDPGNGDWLTYFKTEDALRNAQAFLIQPVQVFLVPEAEKRNIDPKQLDKLSEYFTKAVTDELTAGRYKLVTEPGPGVVVLRFAITNVQPNGGRKNMAVTGAADVALYGTTPPGATMLMPRLSVGSVSIEGEMVDSQSGELEMAFMTSKSGRRFFSGLKAYQKWGDIDAAFKGWAKNFRKRLDKAHQA